MPLIQTGILVIHPANSAVVCSAGLATREHALSAIAQGQTPPRTVLSESHNCDHMRQCVNPKDNKGN